MEQDPAFEAGDVVYQALYLQVSKLSGDWSVSISRQRTNAYSS